MADMEIRPPSGSRKNKRIDGRGNAARRGVKAGKGDKGQNSRSGGGVRPGFEGGQMPLYRRIPRKGFSNFPFKKEFEIVNVSALDKKFSDGETVSLETLKDKRIISKKLTSVKILGEGELKKKLTVDIAAVSAPARAKIEKAGGIVVGEPAPTKTKAKSKPLAASETAEIKDEKGNVDGE